MIYRLECLPLETLARIPELVQFVVITATNLFARSPQKAGFPGVLDSSYLSNNRVISKSTQTTSSARLTVASRAFSYRISSASLGLTLKDLARTFVEGLACPGFCVEYVLDNCCCARLASLDQRIGIMAPPLTKADRTMTMRS